MPLHHQPKDLIAHVSCHTQVMIQLRKFAAKVQRGRQPGGNDTDAEAASQKRSAAAPTSERISLKSDVSQLLGTDMTGIDTSVGGACLASCTYTCCIHRHTTCADSIIQNHTCRNIRYILIKHGRFIYRFACAGVVKRVAALLLVLTALGFVLFFVGYKFAFPEAR